MYAKDGVKIKRHDFDSERGSAFLKVWGRTRCSSTSGGDPFLQTTTASDTWPRGTRPQALPT